MSQQIIDNGEGGLSVRDALNANFTELYGALPLPLKLRGMGANTNQAIAANAMLAVINFSLVSGSPTLRIGTSPNGQQLLDDTVVTGFNQVNANQYFDGAGTVYFTFSGSAGVINVRMDILNNYY